jgi:hypothetical protein
MSSLTTARREMKEQMVMAVSTGEAHTGMNISMKHMKMTEL